MWCLARETVVDGMRRKYYWCDSNRVNRPAAEYCSVDWTIYETWHHVSAKVYSSRVEAAADALLSDGRYQVEAW